MKGNEQSRTWEEQLRRGLDAMSDLGEEQPPDLAALQMLAASVLAEQRRKLTADLLRFWAVAVTLLCLALILASRRPVYFLVWQGAAALLLLIGALAWRGGRKRVIE